MAYKQANHHQNIGKIWDHQKLEQRNINSPDNIDPLLQTGCFSSVVSSSTNTIAPAPHGPGLLRHEPSVNTIAVLSSPLGLMCLQGEEMKKETKIDVKNIEEEFQFHGLQASKSPPEYAYQYFLFFSICLVGS
jgi:hypothetical protein